MGVLLHSLGVERVYYEKVVIFSINIIAPHSKMQLLYEYISKMLCGHCRHVSGEPESKVASVEDGIAERFTKRFEEMDEAVLACIFHHTSDLGCCSIVGKHSPYH